MAEKGWNWTSLVFTGSLSLPQEGRMAGAEGKSGGCCGSYRGGPGERHWGLGQAGAVLWTECWDAGVFCRQLTSTCTVSLLKQAAEWRRPVEMRKAVGGALHVVVSDVRRPGSWRDLHSCQGVGGVWAVPRPRFGRVAPGAGCTWRAGPGSEPGAALFGAKPAPETRRVVWAGPAAGCHPGHLPRAERSRGLE